MGQIKRGFMRSGWHFSIGIHFCGVLQLVVTAGLTEATRQMRTFDTATI